MPIKKCPLDYWRLEALNGKFNKVLNDDFLEESKTRRNLKRLIIYLKTKTAMSDGMITGDLNEPEKCKKISCAIEIDCPGNLQESMREASRDGYHFLVTCFVHPKFVRGICNLPPVKALGRTDRILTGSDWSRYVVGKLSPNLNLDSEIPSIRKRSKTLLLQELGFASHLGLPALLLKLPQAINTNLAQVLNSRILQGANYQIWIQLPMVHPSNFSPLCTAGEGQDSWEWWNNLRTHCNFVKHLCLALELPDIKHLPPSHVIDRWIGEPVKVLIISTTLFLTNQHKQPVLSKLHQEVIQKFMNLDVQYIIRGPKLHESHYRQYNGYMNYLGRKLYKRGAITEFVQGCEDFLQNPLQPLTEHLETMIYEVFEKDQVKYVEYQKAIEKALKDVDETVAKPVIMIVGAGRGPLVQAALNASYILRRRIKVYAIEKNPYAVSTLQDRVLHEWKGLVTLVNEDMRVYNPPELADILVSELLGSFGDNELSPECLDGAQRFLKPGSGVSIPQSYSSFLAPLQSSKIFNEIKTNRPHDKTLENIYETPYVVHLANYYQIAPSQRLFTFIHPNWHKISNDRFGRLRFKAVQNCLLTGFVGYFETALYDNIYLSINPSTHSADMVSWFPIVFPIPEPIHITADDTIQVAFWRLDSIDKVWYEWCVESPIKTAIFNPNGRSYFIKKH